MQSIHCSDVALSYFAPNENRPGSPANPAVSSDRYDYFTSWMRLTMSACFGPYLSHTGLTASWKAFLSVSEISMIWMPAVLGLFIACFSYSTHNFRSSCLASFENFFTATCSLLGSVSQIFLEKTTLSGTIGCSSIV